MSDPGGGGSKPGNQGIGCLILVGVFWLLWNATCGPAFRPGAGVANETDAMAGWEAIRLVKMWCTGGGCVASRPSASDLPGWIQVRVPGPIGDYDARVMAAKCFDAARWSRASIEVLDGSGKVVARCDGLGVRN